MEYKVQITDETTQLDMGAIVSSSERDMWKMLDQINVIMWESYMIKDRPFGREEGRKIMEVLDQWAERH